MAKNTHKVSKRQWRRWDSNSQAMFNRMWSYVHPSVLKMLGANIPLKELRVLRWNICFTAACVMKDWKGFWK